MTTELFEELSARLPYGVKVDVAGVVCTLSGVYKDNKGVWRIVADCEDGRHHDAPLDICKMYLRPLDTMTKAEKDKFNKIINCRNLGEGKLAFPLFPFGSHVFTDIRTIVKISRFFYEHHLDVNRLTGQGLAYKAPEELYKF